jgi:hypothetical protein
VNWQNNGLKRRSHENRRGLPMWFTWFAQISSRRQICIPGKVLYRYHYSRLVTALHILLMRLISRIFFLCVHIPVPCGAPWNCIRKNNARFQKFRKNYGSELMHQMQFADAENKSRALATRIIVVLSLAGRLQNAAHFCSTDTKFAGVQLRIHEN